MRKAAISSGVLGLILLVAAGLLAWWITPSFIARMPGDYNKTRTYDATIRTLFNPAALAAGNLTGAIKTGLPATITENVKVQQTSGNTAPRAGHQENHGVRQHGGADGHALRA
jgi:hypothetical protein